VLDSCETRTSSHADLPQCPVRCDAVGERSDSDPGATEQGARREWVSGSPVGQGRRHPSHNHDSAAV